MNIRKLFLPFCVIFIFCGCSDKSQSNDTNSTKKTAIAKSDFPLTLTTSQDENITINKKNRGFTFSNVKNKAVLLTFITSWCPPCKAEIPHLNILQEKYKNELKIIAVLLEEKNKKDINRFINEQKINFTLTRGKNNFTLAKAIGDVQAVPFIILYDKKGEYATHYVGAILEEMLDVDIQKVVK